jgi:hypothetical protein
MIPKPLETPHMVAHALAYARRGFKVFPVYCPVYGACSCGDPDCENVGKHPRTKHGSSEATADIDQIRKWWGQWPEANIGFPMNDFICIDIDADKDGYVSLEKLEIELGKLPDTWVSETGGGGQHHFFKRNGARCKNSQGLRPGIDLKTNGGYVVASPSLHKTGKRYRWNSECSRTLAELPKQWLDFISSNGNNDGDQPRFDTAGALAGVEEGQRDETCWRLACKLRNADVPFVEALDLVLKAARNCTPPFPADAAQEKVERAYRKYEPKNIAPAQSQPRAVNLSGAEPATECQGITLDDFYAYMPMHSYIFVPGRDLWPASSVDARIEAKNDKGEPLKAHAWLDSNRTVEQMTWAPGKPMLIRDSLISEGGWIPYAGCTCFNLYRPPQNLQGDPKEATEWIAHINKIFPSNIGHIIKWLAHRVQKPQEKINHALVLGGLQGIGKDSLLEPVKYAIGPWNFCEISPAHLLGRFNGFTKSVILRINEARDLGDVDRFSFYDHLKAYTAAPPDVLRCDEKNIREYSVFNVCGVVITSNHKTDGIYLPADDRRHYVAWSDATKDDFTPDYWTKLYRWYEVEGCGHVSAYLRSVDLSQFDPKAPPPKTEAFWSIVDANRAPEDGELADAIDALGDPPAVTLADIVSKSQSDFVTWLLDRRNSRQIPHRMEAADYLPVRNDGAKDGQWKIGERRQAVYARRDLTVRDRIKAARELVESRRSR